MNRERSFTPVCNTDMRKTFSIFFVKGQWNY